MTAKPVIVGGFVLSGLVLGVIGILLFAGTNLLRRSIHAVAYFEGSVAGLDVGAPVTFRGVRVGSVTGIALKLNMRSLTARIPVYLELNPSQISLDESAAGSADPGFDRLLKAGLRAQLNMQSLITGQLRVDLDLRPDVPGNPMGSDSGLDEIPTIPSKLETLEDEIAELPLAEIAENARGALVSIQHLADAITPRVGPLADSLQRTADGARVTLSEIDGLATDGRHQLAARGDQLGQLLASSDRTAREAEAAIASLREMTAPGSRVRSDFQAALRDLAASASSLRVFSQEIERNPSALLLGRAKQ